MSSPPPSTNTPQPPPSTSVSLTPTERTACTALSTLFLDTEISVPSLTASLQSLHLPVQTLTNLLRYDVFPVLYPNLLSTAGVWGGFDDVWLYEQIEKRRAKRAVAGVGERVQDAKDWMAWYTVGQSVVMPSWKQVLDSIQGARL